MTGLTLDEIRKPLEAHLSQFLLEPEISVDVQSYNSKIYYVVLDGGGAGQTVIRLPITGNETVIDALSQVNGLSAVSSQDRIGFRGRAGGRLPPGAPRRLEGRRGECRYGDELSDPAWRPGLRRGLSAHEELDITLAT